MKKVWFRVGMEAEITDSDWRILNKFANCCIMKNYHTHKYTSKNTSCTQKEIDEAVRIIHDMIATGNLSGETYIPENFDDDRYANDQEIDFDFD